MRHLTIWLAAFLLIASVSVAQDTSGEQETGATAKDSAVATSHDEKPTEDSRSTGDHHKYHLRLGTITVGGGYFLGPVSILTDRTAGTHTMERLFGIRFGVRIAHSPIYPILPTEMTRAKLG
jgi:hypothetical protein